MQQMVVVVVVMQSYGIYRDAVVESSARIGRSTAMHGLDSSTKYPSVITRTITTHPTFPQPPPVFFLTFLDFIMTMILT